MFGKIAKAVRLGHKTQKFIQGVGIAGQIVAWTAPFIPEPARMPISVALGAAQGAAAALAPYTNPDGSPAEAAWTPKKK